MRCSSSLVITEIKHFTFISDQQKLENCHSCYYCYITIYHKNQLLQTMTFYYFSQSLWYRDSGTNLAERFWPRVKKCLELEKPDETSHSFLIWPSPLWSITWASLRFLTAWPQGSQMIYMVSSRIHGMSSTNQEKLNHLSQSDLKTHIFKYKSDF